MTLDDLAHKLISDLDEIARDCDCYGFGLPVHEGPKFTDMLAVVLEALKRGAVIQVRELQPGGN